MFRPTIGNFILYLLGVTWLMLFIWMGVGVYNETPKQIEKDKSFIIEQINPHIASINSFKTINHRLPSVEEFNNFEHLGQNLGNVDYIRDEQHLYSEVRSSVKGINWSKNYVLMLWRGEWAEYYISEGNRYITNNYSTSDGIIGMLIAFTIGILPLTILIIFQQRKYIKSKKS